MECDTVWLDARLATMSGPGLGLIDDGVIAAKDGRIVYAGPSADAPSIRAVATVRCEGRLVTPGLIDCHTHLVFGGNRAREFELRLEGATYEEIARSGGGIVSTMRATRDATEAELTLGALSRLDHLMAEGVTTIEVKSGYGLERESELKMLRVARELGRQRNVAVTTTFLGAHALPPEFAGDADGYIDMLIADVLPAVAEQGLADAVDAFCENIGFTAEQVGRVFRAATDLGLPVKLHAEQLSDSGGAELAAGFGAQSADHLEFAGPSAIAAMAASGTVATLLPGAYYFVRETKLPPIAEFRAAGVPMALATDCNPGTSPLTSILLTLNMGATLFRMTVEECLLGVTRNAALALGMAGRVGTLEAGKQCDLAIWDVEQPAELVYRMGFNPLHARVWSGQ